MINVLKICVFVINVNGEGGEKKERGGGELKKTQNILGGQAHRLTIASFINHIHVFSTSLCKSCVHVSVVLEGTLCAIC